jgi:uncharacterized RDD family membrane protein YckC
MLLAAFRAAAFTVDILLLLIALVVLSVLLLAAGVELPSGVISLLFPLVAVAYFTLTQASRWHASPGMRAFYLKLAPNGEGGTLSLSRLLVRNLLVALPGLPYRIYVLLNPEKVAGTHRYLAEWAAGETAAALPPPAEFLAAGLLGFWLAGWLLIAGSVVLSSARGVHDRVTGVRVVKE